MGSEDNEETSPVHNVTLSPYYMAHRPVTWGQFRAFCGATGRTMPRNAGPDDSVASGLCFDEALAYADWAGLVIPTEAQWENALRSLGEEAIQGPDTTRLEWCYDLYGGYELPVVEGHGARNVDGWDPPLRVLRGLDGSVIARSPAGEDECHPSFGFRLARPLD